MEYGLADMNKNLSQVLQEIEINVILKKAFKDKNGLKYKKIKIKTNRCNGTCGDDGSWYYFDVNGACQGIDTSYTGWHLDDSGKWYYIRNGHAVTGTTVIDGVLYEFDGYGVWNLKS